MPKSIIGGWRAFSLTKQADIATAAAANTLLNFEGTPFGVTAEKYYVNDDEITGELLPTSKRLLTRKLEGVHKTKCFPHVVGLFAAMAMGKDTVAGSGPYTHDIEIDKTVVELPYRTMVENDGAGQSKYAGVACSGFSLSAQRGEFVEFEAQLIGRGTEETDGGSQPPRVAETYMTFGDATLSKGGTYDGTSVTGGTDVSAQLQQFKFSFSNNGKGAYLFGDSSGVFGAIRRGEKYQVELEATLEIEDGAYRTEFLNGTEFVLYLPIVGGANYKVELILPRVAFMDAPKGVSDGILHLAGKFAVLSDPTYGGLVVRVTNQQQASYLAAA